jgi:hypothetical protein
MSSKDHMSLDDIKDAKPTFRPTAEEWVDSERGRQVLERVLAADRAARPTVYRTQSRRASWATRPRLAFAGGFVVIVAVAVALAVAFSGNGGTKGVGPVASTPGSTEASTPTSASDSTLTSAGSGQVTLEAALADVVPLYLLYFSQNADRGSENTDSLTEQAVEFGLVSDAQASDAATSPLTNGAYAVLLANAFGRYLPQNGASSESVDPAATPDESKAIGSLMRAGVLLPADGDFVAGQPLSKSLQRLLLGRVRNILVALEH